MTEIDVIIKIGDPWELGEELGWPSIDANLLFENNLGVAVLRKPISYKGKTYSKLDLTPRYRGFSISDIKSKKVVANFLAGEDNCKIAFTGSVEQRFT